MRFSEIIIWLGAELISKNAFVFSQPAMLDKHAANFFGDA